ncbi:MAG: calcium-binding protein [Pseudomonadota bacterium]
MPTHTFIFDEVSGLMYLAATLPSTATNPDRQLLLTFAYADTFFDPSFTVPQFPQDGSLEFATQAEYLDVLNQTQMDFALLDGRQSGTLPGLLFEVGDVSTLLITFMVETNSDFTEINALELAYTFPSFTGDVVTSTFREDFGDPILVSDALANAPSLTQDDDVFNVPNLGVPVTLDGYGGDDELVGSTGSDRLSGSQGDDLILGLDDKDTLLGGSGDDTLRGGEDWDVLRGGIGDDFVYGGRGKDRLFGENGDDYLVGSLGSDTIKGGSGDDTLRGGREHDTLEDGAGKDIMYGGSDSYGADVFVLVADGDKDKIMDFSANDKIDISAWGENLTLADLKLTDTAKGGVRIRYEDEELVVEFRSSMTVTAETFLESYLL